MNQYADYCKELASVCKSKKLKLNHKRLNNGYKFHYIEINKRDDSERAFCLSSSIHGDEVAGAYAILKFLEQYKSSKFYFLIFPVVNPYGFDKKQRYNAMRQDINRRFCDKLLVGESRVAYNLIKAHKINLFYSLHEWIGRDGFYMYASDKIKKDAYNQVYKKANKYFKVFTDRKINDEQVDRGVIWHPEEGYSKDMSRCTLENRMYNEGTHYVCVETPSESPLEKRVNCQLDVLNFILESYD